MKLRVTLWVCSLPMSPVSSSHLSPIPSFLTHLKTKPTDSHSSDTISHYSMPTLCQIHGKPITSLGLQSPNKDGFVTVVILKYVHKFTDTPSIQRRGLILFPFSMGWTWWLPSNRIKQKLQGAIFSAGYDSFSSFFLLHHLLRKASCWGMGTLLLSQESHVVRNCGLLLVAPWVSLEVDPQVPVKPADNCNHGQHLSHNLMRGVN